MGNAPEHQRIAKGGLTDDEQREGLIAALHRERDAYLRMGMDERASQVAEQLRGHGVDVGSEKVSVESGDQRSKAPRGRSAKPQHTTKD